MFGTLIRHQFAWRWTALAVFLLVLAPTTVADHTAFVQSALSGKCVEVANDSTANGADARQWTCDGGQNQTILFTPTASTARVFTLRFAHSNKCLEVAGNSTSSGANLEQSSCDGGTNQQFELVPVANNQVEIMPRQSGLRVSLASASNTNGVSLIQSTDVNGTHQRWLLLSSDTRDPSVFGQWGPMIPWPHIAVSGATLPDGRVLTFSGSERETWPGNEFTYSATWDPATGAFVEIDHLTHNMFCAHLAMTEDGQVFVNGGRNQTNSPWTSLFDYSNNQWTALDNMASGGRWYPTTLALTDGDMFTAVGTASNQRNPERYDSRTGWKVLTGIDFQTPVLDYQATHGEANWWTLLHLAPQGKIFHSGPTPAVGWINPTGNGSYEDTGLRIDGWYHKHGTTIMYDEGKILTAGGWIDGGNVASTNQAFTVDLNGPVPDVQLTNSMTYARKFHNGVMLPNGEVLVVGGNTSGQKFNDSGTIYATEFWNPNSGAWREGAAMMLPRNYHSIALLLPDGRVLSAGGGYCSGSAYCSGSSHQDGQLFTPPYLFNANGTPATRPTISSGPGLIENATVFDVQAGGSVAYFSMIKMGATTHGMNTDVRFLPVDSQDLGGGTHRLTANGNPNVLSPGYWMLFAVGTNGAPSVAHIVRVTNKDVLFDNIALFGSASQSSTYVDGALDFSASNALDGDMTGTDISGSITHTNQDPNSWWELDLHSVFDIDSIRLWNRTDCCSTRLSNFYVLVSDDPFLSTDLAATRAQSGVTEYYVSAAVDNQLDLAIGRTGRFVRVQLASSNFLSLAEVQLFGESPGAGTAGLVHYDYYDGAFTTLPDFRTLTPNRSGTVDGFNLSPATATDNFAIRFYGKIDIASNGTYTFYTSSDDGSRLWIDGQLVVDNDGLHGAQQRQGSISLAPGSHDIEVGFFEATGGASLAVSYSGPGFSQQSIPLGALSLLPPPNGGGSLLREWWTGIAGTGVAALTGSPSYPDSPTGSNLPTSFEAPTNWADDYGTRMRGMLHVPFSGNYTFWIASDDGGELWLSTDDQAANAQLIASVPSWSASREWDKFPEQQSLSIYLQSGQRYYIEALQKEGGGGDNLAVAWETPFAARAVIDGGYLSTPFAALQILAIGAPPQVVTGPVTMTATAVGEGVNYSWSFGDGSADTPFSDSSVINHTYSSPGRYSVTLTVSDSFGNQEETVFQQLVHGPLTANKPNASSSIVFHDARAEVWNVNPDNASVTAIDANNDVRIAEIPVSAEPRGLTVASDGRIWVGSKASATVSVIDPSTLQVVATIPMPRGSRPHGIVASRATPDVYVALEATGELRRYDALSLNLIDSQNFGVGIRHLSIDAGGTELLISRFVTPPVPGESSDAPNIAGIGGQVFRVRTSDLTLNGTTLLQHSNRLASESSGPGLPNYLQAAVISPDGANAWVASKQDNILRGMLRDGSELTHDHTVRAVSSRILLPSGSEQFSSRVDHDNASVGSATAFGPFGVHLFTALEGNRQIAISDAFLGSELMRFDVGRAPQGLAVSPSGTKLYVHNFMDRSVSVVDIARLTSDGNLQVTPLATIASVTTEALTAQVLLGKQHFYDAKDPRLALESYMSCASCHNGGGEDGRVWDFTGVGEGLRNTITLQGHGSAVHGMLHWSGNFDEVQDFENQIRGFSRGTGLMTDPDFTATEDILGPPKAGRSADLDALAAYVHSLITVPTSPHRDTTGGLTASAQAGLQLFQSFGCDSCHSGLALTDSSTGLRHDVGTIRTSSGNRLGGTLDGLDSPTLLGAWNTSPYLHDGSAVDLAGAILAHIGNESLTQTEIDQLVDYLKQAEIGVAENPCGPGGNPGPDDNCNGVDDDCNGLIDDAYTSSISTCGTGECAGNTGTQTCSPVTIYGSNRDGDMVNLNLNSFVDQQVGSLAFGTQAMELDSATGRIYYYEWQTSGDEFGYWDPATGLNTVVRTYTPSLGFYGKRMAQHPDGTMYLGDGNENLYTIDLTNGNVTFLGAMTGLEVGNLGATGDHAFAPDGTLYIVNYRGLYTLDLNTLQATLLADNLLNGVGINVFTGVAYCHGQIYASDVQEATGRSAILRIDPQTLAIEELWLTGDYLNDLSSCPSDGTPPVETDTCDPFFGASTEICDGLDNDCDGAVDEDGICDECTVNADCDDNVFCNGNETCNAGSCVAGTPVVCDDSIACTTDSCDENGDTCLFAPVDTVCDDGIYCNGSEVCDLAGGCQSGSDPCPGLDCDEQSNICIIPDCVVDSECDDGQFCNGAETCNAGTCAAGTPVSCDDGIACTADSCDEAADSCRFAPVDSACDDGTFCNGSEICDPVGGCQTGSDPCNGNSCDEIGDVCIVPECTVDTDCDDGIHCNGAETCSAETCIAGTPVSCDDGIACTADSCNEGTDSCDFTPVDSVCDDGTFCNGTEICDPGAGCLATGVDPCNGDACDELTDTCDTGLVPLARLESGTVTVGGTHVTVQLTNAYVDPVVVCTTTYTGNTTPVVTRVTAVTSTSFDVRLQNPSNGPVQAETVHYIVAEAGAWEIDGVRFEAQKYSSSITSNAGAWVPEAQNYLQGYADPVVIGQVMSENDPSWSVFWSQGVNRSTPPSAAALSVGKTTMEDGTGRVAETVGFIVFETTHGIFAGVEVEAGETSATIQGIDDNPPFSAAFDASFAGAPQVAVVTMAAVDGGNGGWMYLYGGTPLSGSAMQLALDEDQIYDAERTHIAEQAHYVAFASSFAYELVPECTTDTDCDDGAFCNGTETCSGGSCQPGSDPCNGDVCDEGTDSCIAPPGVQLESLLVTAGATPVTVSLTNTYLDPVVVCTIQYLNNTQPVVTRVSQASGNSFQLRIQGAGATSVANETVHCLVVESGVHEIGGLRFEAQKTLSTITDDNNSWVAQAATYGRSYTNPVVLGQVMTENDSRWSAFWTRGNSRSNPPTGTSFFVGKMVAEDPVAVRANETLGVIVIEAAHSSFAGTEFEATLGTDTIAGIDSNPPFNYTFGTNFSAAPAVVIATMAAMDGNNGGWAQLHGSTVASTTTLALSIDEDTLADPERTHTSEQVGYIAFGSEFVYP